MNKNAMSKEPLSLSTKRMLSSAVLSTSCRRNERVGIVRPITVEPFAGCAGAISELCCRPTCHPMRFGCRARSRLRQWRGWLWFRRPGLTHDRQDVSGGGIDGGFNRGQGRGPARRPSSCGSPDWRPAFFYGQGVAGAVLDQVAVSEKSCERGLWRMGCPLMIQHNQCVVFGWPKRSLSRSLNFLRLGANSGGLVGPHASQAPRDIVWRWSHRPFTCWPMS